MKISFEKDKLMAAINIVQRAVPSKSTMTILQCILVDASSAEIRLTGNDTEFGIETKAEGTILEHGRVALEARLFSEMIRKLSGDDEIVIETDEKLTTVITSGKTVFRIQGMDAMLYSYVPHIDRAKYISLSQFRLKEIIRQTIFCTSPNDSNKLMTGEYLKVSGDHLMLAALDGHRMAIRNVTLGDSYGDFSLILPGKNLNEISRILADDDEAEVLIFFDDNHAMFEFGDTIVLTRLIDGEYFHVEMMLTRDYTTKVTVNRQQFLTEIDKATILIRESDKKPIVLNITDEEMQIRLRSNYGTLNTEIPVVKTGNDLMIGFNPSFYMDALRNIDEEEVTLYMINAKSPCFIRDDDENYIYLILPVNFNAEDI